MAPFTSSASVSKTLKPKQLVSSSEKPNQRIFFLSENKCLLIPRAAYKTLTKKMRRK